MTIKEIVDLINAGKYEEVSREDLALLARSAQEATSGTAKPDSEKWRGLDPAKQAAEMTAALESMRNSPQGQEHLKEALINSKSSRFTSQYGPFFQALLAGTDVITSLNQISASKNALARMTKPGIPTQGGLDPRLDNAIRQAEIGTQAAPQAANVAKSDIFDQYMQDLKNSQISSGGQQSIFGSGAQVASYNRNKALARLIPMTNDIQMQRQNQLNQLIGQRQGFANQQFGNNLQATQMRLGQYNQDAQAAGALGSQGRLNMRQTLGGIAGLMPQLGARLFPVSNPYLKQDQGAQTSTQPGVYNPQHAEYEQLLNMSLNNHLNLRKAQQYENPYYTPNTA